MFSKVFLLDSLERAIKTFAQALLALFVGGSANILTVNYGDAFAVAGTAVIVSLLTSIVSSQFGSKQSASLVSGQVEQGVVNKIEDGEPVGDPAVFVEPADVVPAEPEKA